jgi:sn-1 stearoyl-lipid 9-desaturase
MFRHSAWMANVAYYVGVAALIAALMLSPSMLGYSFVLYLMAAVTLSVGYHRLFCHGAFVTPRFWHYAFATFGVLFMYSSPLQWVVTHATHHKHSDTDLDPHEGPLKPASMFRKGYRNVPLKTILAKRLLRDKMHLFVDRYYALLWLAMATAIFVASPQVFIYCYLPAVGAAHLVAAMHQTFSHIGGKPNDLWVLEYILPSSGEWLHDYHHKHWRSCKFATKWYHLDMGSWVISAIKSSKSNKAEYV